MCNFFEELEGGGGVIELHLFSHIFLLYCLVVKTMVDTVLDEVFTKNEFKYIVN